MDWQAPFFIILMLVGIIYVIAGLLLYQFPPKKMNYLYGYRTKASMADQETWDFAQRFSAVEMMKMGAALMATSCIASFFPIPDLTGTILAVALMIIAVVLMIIRIEKAIKNRKK